MHKYERIGFWILFTVVALFTAINYRSSSGLNETIRSHTNKLDTPVVRATVVPGIPEMLENVWKQAKDNAQDADIDDQLWLTVRLTNEGYEPAGNVIADLSFVPNIDGLYVYTADGLNLETSPYGRPNISEGGHGAPTAKVEFDKLAPGKSHVIFVGLRPRDFGAPPYDREDLLRWADTHALYWNAVTVTSAKDASAKEKSTVIEYGIGSTIGLK
jgi:hypothetical protein